MSPVSTSAGGSPSGGSSRSSGGYHARPSAAKAVASSGASGSDSSDTTKAGAPAACSSAVPNRSGSAAMSPDWDASTVSPIARRSSRSMIATICGSAQRSAPARGPAPRRHTPPRAGHTSPATAARRPPARPRGAPRSRRRAPTPGRAAGHAAAAVRTRGRVPRAAAPGLGPTRTSRAARRRRRPELLGVRTPSARAISPTAWLRARDSARALPGRGRARAPARSARRSPWSRPASRAAGLDPAPGSHAARERGRAV